MDGHTLPLSIIYFRIFRGFFFRDLLFLEPTFTALLQTNSQFLNGLRISVLRISRMDFPKIRKSGLPEFPMPDSDFS